MKSAARDVEPRGAANIASTLRERSRITPRAAAVLLPGRRKEVRAAWTFQELDERSDALGAGLESIGIGAGARTVLMVPPSLELFALTFALFKRGIVPVIVDPGMGVKSLGRCLAEARPAAFIGVPRANAARALLGWGRGSIRTIVTIGRARIGKGFTLREVGRRGGSAGRSPPVEAEPGSAAAILFTSGSTGPPKGAVYTHANFAAQIESLRETYSIEPGEVDLCTFPLFALFAPALGMTAVIPEMDPTRPARADPRKILGAIERFHVTNLFGSPALIGPVGAHAAARGIRLPTLRRVISAGAPVPARVVERFAGLLAAGVQVHTPYGATEALPVSTIGSDAILGETRRLTEQGRGVCVGRPVAGVEVDIVRTSDAPIDAWHDGLRAPRGEIGEITVRGANVTREYFGRPDATRLAKIRETDGIGFHHRMGDLGYLDEEGRVWFCGRKSQRVTTSSGVLHTIPCEAIFNVHPRVARTALVGRATNGAVEPVLCVELAARSTRHEREEIRRELLELGAAHAPTRPVLELLFHPGFPVDIRHNAKIGREKLALWAAKRRKT